jgi:tetratricopeptide (TPR) repeat protein/predicted Ser/Thr protein kinase
MQRGDTERGTLRVGGGRGVCLAALIGYPRGVSSPEGDATLTAMDRPGEPAVSLAELGAGARIGRYVIARRLGAGGMGVVYAARDSELARDVALKIVRPRAEVDAMQARLRREAKAMARLSHPNVVPVFDIGTHDGQLFIAMELVDGETLRSWVARPRPWRSVVELFVKVGRGLEAAHAAGLLHRDFKPDNVVVGRGDEPRITDFGLARELDDGTGATVALAEGTDSELSLITRTGTLAGTPAYMAPEQLLGRHAGAAADQFGFCVSLFEVLYGMRPFRPAAPRPDALIPEIRAGRIVKPPRAVPAWLHAAIVRGLAFEPDQRWPSMTALLGALGRGRRGRRLAVIAAVAGVAIAAAGAGVAVARLGPERGPPASCAELARQANDAATILVCKDEYTRSNDPAAGLELANALRRTGKLQDAAIIANELLATPVRADALRALGRLAAGDGRRDDAARSFRLASQQHRAQQRWGDSAADLQALAGISNDFVDQLVVLDEAAADAHRGGDPRIEAVCHLTSARILSEIGARSGALAELERAAPLMTRPGDVVQLDFERGNVYQNLGEDGLAVPQFERARAGAEAVTNRRLALAASHNLVYSLAGAGRAADAARQLTAANALDPTDHERATRLSLEARIAERGGDLVRAAARIDEAIAATDADATGDLIEHHTERAEIALRRGELVVAEQSARRAIALIETVRSNQPPAELRSWMITDRRIPYQLLFAVLARRGDAAGALEAFERYRGLAVLAGLAHGAGPAAQAPAAGYPVGDLARLFPLLQASPLASAAPERAIRDAVRGASLLVLAVAHDELWRITAQDGQLEIASLGPLAALQPQIERLRAAPADRAAAAALGAALVPAALAGPSDRVLHVVLDEPLAAVPLAALWVGDRRWIAARPIVRAARVADVGCAAAPGGPRHVVVIGDPLAGRQLPAVTPGATRSALLDAGRSELLDVRVPVAADALDDALVLRDGRVRALEIAGHGGVAGRVVLAGSPTGPEGTAGLAMAFLAAGADQVIATLGPVPRAALDRLTERLHGADPGDLVRALARIQATAEGRGDDDAWLRVEAFGRELCHPQP